MTRRSAQRLSWQNPEPPIRPLQPASGADMPANSNFSERRSRLSSRALISTVDHTVNANDLLFEVRTPLGFSIRVTADRWKLIVTAKHPVMVGRERLVRSALEAPDEVRQSRIDSQVLLFYKAETTRRWTCAVAKRAAEGAFLITAYPTDAIKEGVRIWPK